MGMGAGQRWWVLAAAIVAGGVLPVCLPAAFVPSGPLGAPSGRGLEGANPRGCGIWRGPGILRLSPLGSSSSPGRGRRGGGGGGSGGGSGGGGGRLRGQGRNVGGGGWENSRGGSERGGRGGGDEREDAGGWWDPGPADKPRLDKGGNGGYGGGYSTGPRASERSSVDETAKQSNIEVMGSVMAKGTGTIMGQEMQSVLGEGQTVDGVIEHGRKVAQSLVDAGIILDSAAFNVIISAAWRTPGGGLEAAQRGLALMDEFGVEPDVFTCNIMIDSCRVTKDRRDKWGTSSVSYQDASAAFRKGMEVLEMMRRRGVVPDVVTYTTLIHMCSPVAEVGGIKGLSPCLDLLDEMEAEGLAPNRLTFNSAIDVCAKAAGGGAPADACLEQGLILLSTMENRALTPNVVTFVSLIDLCSRCALADDWARHFEDPALPLEQGVLIFKRFVNEYRADVTLNRSFNLLLNTCTRLPDHKEGLQRAIALIEAVRGTDVSPGIYAYNKLIDMCRSIVDGSDRAKSREGLEQLVKLQELMKQAGVTPDIVTYTGLVDVFGRAGLGMKAVQQGEEVLRLMKNDGIKPDVVVYNVLINNCQRGALASKSVSEILKYLNAGRDLVEAMVGEGLDPDPVTLSQLFNMCRTIADRGEGRASMKLGSEIIGMMDRIQVKPNDLLAKAYIELGSAATLAGADPSFCLREGWRLLEVARKGPGAINDGTYTCMMDACSKSASMGNRDALKLAFHLIDVMETEGPAPTVIVCNALLDCIAKAVAARTMRNGVSEGRAFLEVMRHMKVEPDLISYNTMLDMTAKEIGVKGKGLGEVVRTLSQMRESKIEPDIITYNSVLNACSKSARQGNVAALHTALDIIGQVEDTGSSVRPNVISYNAVIDAVAGGLAYGDERHRCFDEALKVYRRMQAQYVQPTVITYTALISAAKLQGTGDGVSEAYNLFCEMPVYIRNHRTFVAMMGAFSVVGRASDAVRLLDVARDSGLKPNIFMYSSAVSASRHDAAEVRRLVQSMERDGVMQNEVIKEQVRKALSGHYHGHEGSGEMSDDGLYP